MICQFVIISRSLNRLLNQSHKVHPLDTVLDGMKRQTLYILPVKHALHYYFLI